MRKERMSLSLLAVALAVVMGCNRSGGEAAAGPDKEFRSAYKPVKREYWITTEVIYNWDMVPEGKAMMTTDSIAPERRYLYKAIRYIQTDSTGRKLSSPTWLELSGPLLRCTAGDSLIVHFTNGANTGMPLSMHPHNLLYDEANEGVWRADKPEGWPEAGTAGGAVKPGDAFTYRWAAREASVGVGPYHSHAFRPAEEVGLGLIGLIVVDLPPDHPEFVKFDTTIGLVFKTYLAKVAAKDSGNPDPIRKDTCANPLIPWNGGCHPREHVPVDQWPENIRDTAAHGGGPEVHTINGIAYANLKGLAFTKGQKVRFAVVAMNDEGTQNHTLHFHGEMLREMSRRNLYKDVFDLPSAVAIDLIMDADNPGNWMLHCHVEHHASEMMAVYRIADAAASVTPGATHAEH